MSRWEERKLGELIHIKHGFAFKGEYITDYDNGIVLVTPGNFKIGGGFKHSGKKYYNGEIPEDYILKSKSLIVTMTDLSKNADTLGYAAYSPTDGKTYLHNQRIGLVSIISDDVVESFLYWLLRSPAYQRRIANTCNGVNVKHTSPERIYSYKFLLPNKSTQTRIADILSSYDDLIENNNRRIQLLEQTAQELYKEWFVRFRFPGHEKVKFENGLPEGWEIKTLGDIAVVIMGQSPTSDNYNENNQGLPFHQGVGSYGDFYLKDKVYSIKGNKIANPQSIIFSVRAPVGRINVNLNKIILGRGVASINSKYSCNYFLLWQLKYYFSKEDTIGNGSIFTSVTKDDLLKYKLIYPVDSLMKDFNEIAQNIELEIRTIYLTNVNLIKQRDLLLPRLMSGKLEV